VRVPGGLGCAQASCAIDQINPKERAQLGLGTRLDWVLFSIHNRSSPITLTKVSFGHCTRCSEIFGNYLYVLRLGVNNPCVIKLKPLLRIVFLASEGTIDRLVERRHSRSLGTEG
jgi:hypothetical protein